MARAVIAGARHAEIVGVEVRVRDALEADADDVLWADAMIFGTPENFGYMSGAMKYFLDRIYYDCLDRVAGRPYALFIRAGNDGRGAIGSIERILLAYRVRSGHCRPHGRLQPAQSNRPLVGRHASDQ
jgi:multimeric flavodoxin WrbA